MSRQVPGPRNAGGRDPLRPMPALFGEESGRVLQSVHIEPLADRSALYDWSIEAHTHGGFHQVVLLSDGRVDVTLDESTRPLSAPGAIAIPAGVVHSFEYRPASVGFVLGIADHRLEGATTDSWVRSRLFEHPVSLALDPTAMDRVARLASEALAEQSSAEPHGSAALDWLIRALLVLVAREADRADRSAPGSRDRELFAEFRTAVEEHHTEHWPVRRYAELLAVSASSLDRASRSVSGRTAFEVCQERVEVEARRRLTYTTAPVRRIAADLGFTDPSYFSRFFRRRVGSSPREFRATVQAHGNEG